MALNVKVALSACLLFTGGLCWLVEQVARPVATLPPAAVVRAPADGEVLARRITEFIPRVEPAPVEAVFANAAPIRREQQRYPVPLFDVATMRFANSANDVELPPIAHADDDASVSGPTIAQRPRTLFVGGANAEPVRPSAPIAMIPEHVPSAVLVSSEVVSDVKETLQADVDQPIEAADTVQIMPTPEPMVAEATPKAREYIVQPGDTIAGIVRREFRTETHKAIQALLDANPQLASRKDRIIAGEAIMIPAVPAIVDDGPVVRLAADDGETVRAASRHRRTYTIQASDTLTKIAREKLNDPARWREIATLNGLTNADRIFPGMEIELPADAAPEASVS